MTTFTIITVCYNAEKHIKKCIESVTMQSHPDVEYIIVDGDSNDLTLDIIEKQRSNVTHIISDKDKGMYDALNKGLELATGDFIAALNADDRYIDGSCLSRVSSAIENNPGHSVYYGDLVIKSDKGERLRKSIPANLEDLIAYGTSSIATLPSSFIDRRLNKNTRYNLEYKCAADYDYLIRCAENGTCHHLGFPTTIFTRHNASITNTESKKMSEETKKISDYYASKTGLSLPKKYYTRTKLNFMRLFANI